MTNAYPVFYSIYIGKMLLQKKNKSDFSHSFKLWEDNDSKTVYLAAIEAIDGAVALEGWTKRIISGYKYLYVKCTEENVFPKVVAYIQEQGYMFFPIRKL